jgi:hypothetical protein
MPIEFVDEPELVHQVARVIVDLRLAPAQAGKVIDLAALCFDAGVAAGLVARAHPSPEVADALKRVSG